MTDRSILAATPFAGEAFLVSWSESSRGRKVTFELSADSEVHPFKEFKHGTRFMLAATKIGDDEQPAKVKSPAVIGAQAEPAQQKKHFRDMPRSQQAALKLQDADFASWLINQPLTVRQDLEVSINAGDGSHAAFSDALLKTLLSITSKRDLDSDPDAATRWDQMLASYDFRDRA